MGSILDSALELGVAEKENDLVMQRRGFDSLPHTVKAFSAERSKLPVSDRLPQTYLLKSTIDLFGPPDPSRFLHALGPVITSSEAREGWALNLRKKVRKMRSNKRHLRALPIDAWREAASSIYESLFVNSLKVDRHQGARKASSEETHGFIQDTGADLDYAGGYNVGIEASETIETIALNQTCGFPDGVPATARHLYNEFMSNARTSAVCVKWRHNKDNSGATAFAAQCYFPTLSELDFSVTKKPPTFLEISGSNVGADSTFEVKCTCRSHQLAKQLKTTSDLSLSTQMGREGGICFHERAIREPGFIKNILQRLEPLAGLDTHYPSFTSVLLNGPLGHRVPKHAYVWTSSPRDTSVLGHSREAVLTISRGKMSCSVCSRGRRLDENSKKKSSCVHIEGQLVRFESPCSDSDRIALEVFKPQTAGQTPLSPAFDVSTQQYVFDSLSSRIESVNASKYGISVPVVVVSRSASVPSSRMGGKFDIDMRCIAVHTELSQNRDPWDVFVRNRLLDPICPSCHQGGCISSAAKATEGSQSPMQGVDVDIDGSDEEHCRLCREEPTYRCDACAIDFCYSCVREGDCGVLPSLALLFPGMVCHDGQVINSTSDVDTIKDHILSTWNLDSLLHDEGIMEGSLLLRPSVPQHMKCSFEKITFKDAGTTTIYFPTRKIEGVPVKNLICDNGCCTIEPTGAEVGCHRQTKDTAIHYDVIHLFHWSMRNMRGPGIKAFAAFVQELYRLNGNGAFMKRDAFAACYYGLKCRELRGKSLNRPCFTCKRIRVKGVWGTACPVIAIDAKVDITVARRQLIRRTAKAPDVPEPGAPKLDCRRRTHLSRLFFPGNSKTPCSTYRALFTAVSKKVLDHKLTKNDTASLGKANSSYMRFLCDGSLAPYHNAFQSVYDIFADGGSPAEEAKRTGLLARWFLAISNDQTEMCEWLAPRDCDFIDDCLRRSLEGKLTLDFTRKAETMNVRRSLVALVEAYVERQQLESGPSIRLREDVAMMLRRMCEQARQDFADGEKQPMPPDYPAPLPADYSSGVAMFFTKTGGKLRPYPQFVNVGTAGSRDEVRCDKTSWTQQQGKRHQFRGDGNETFMCVVSGVVLGTVFLDSPEGRSTATAALYTHCLKTDEDVTVISDTACMHSRFVSNRLRRFFLRWKWLLDRFHMYPHKCKLCFNPNDFAFLDGENLSLIEQWHALVDALSVSIQRMTLDHAMFFLQLLIRDRYDELAARAGVDSDKTEWPADDMTSDAGAEAEEPEGNGGNCELCYSR